jgi:hypothetical protein
MPSDEIPELEARLQAALNEFDRVNARIADGPGPEELQRLKTKAAELDGEMAGLRNQIRLAEEQPGD